MRALRGHQLVRLCKPQQLFDLLSIRTINELRGANGHAAEWITEATLKVAVNGKTMHTVAEGDGPVHALDNALRQAMREAYPQIDSIRLTDFKVRVVTASEGTAAKVRTIVESTDGDGGSWSTVGVSTNIIEASWLALVDAIEYGLLRETRK